MAKKRTNREAEQREAESFLEAKNRLDARAVASIVIRRHQRGETKNPVLGSIERLLRRASYDVQVYCHRIPERCPSRGRGAAKGWRSFKSLVKEANVRYQHKLNMLCIISTA